MVVHSLPHYTRAPTNLTHIYTHKHTHTHTSEREWEKRETFRLFHCLKVLMERRDVIKNKTHYVGTPIIHIRKVEH